jgi:hypothetical protein
MLHFVDPSTAILPAPGAPENGIREVNWRRKIWNAFF